MSDLTTERIITAIKLKPCPFCGGAAEIVTIEEGENAGGSCVSCTRCMASSNVEFEFKENFVSNWNRRAALAHDEQAAPAHADDIAVDRFAAAMKAKLEQKRAEGRGGWDDAEQCSIALLSRLLVEHIDKGDPVDVGNLAMMIHQRGGSIASDRERYADQQAQRALRADELESLKCAFSSAPPGMLEPGSNCPHGFVWIDQPVTVKGGDYTYAGQLLLSFPKSVGGAVRYIVRDGNNRLFIHNARQCGLEADGAPHG